MKKNIASCIMIFLFASHYAHSCDLPPTPPPGTRLWNVVVEDLFVDITTLSKVCNINSFADVIINEASIVSALEVIQSIDQLIASEVMVIDTRTSNIASNVNNIYSLDQIISSNVNNIYTIDQTILSKVDVINNIDQTILSKIMVIDTRTSNIQSNVDIIYSLDQVIASNVDNIYQTDQTILSKVMVIDTRTSNIQSNVTNIYNLDQTINSKLDTVITTENSILSKIAALSTCCTTTQSNEPFVSIYATEEIGNRFDSINIQFQYGIPSSSTTSYTQGGATVTAANSMAVLSSAAAAGISIAQLQSKPNIIFRSGHDTYALFTVAFTGSFIASSSQFIGPIDYQNGYAIGFDGTTFGITMRNNTSNTFIPQSSFNGDKLDGTGTSGFTYNPALLNVFRIDYGDPGGSVVKFRIMNSTGTWITFHTIQYPNSSATPSILQPFLPITALVEKLAGAAGASTLTLKTASWNAGIVGNPNYTSYRYFQTNNTIAISSTSATHILTIKNNTVFNNQPNHIQARIAIFGGGPSDNINANVATFFLYKNATLTGSPSFSDVDTGNSIMQVSTAGTYTASTGTLLYSYSGRVTGQVPFLSYLTDVFPIMLYPGETATLVVQTYTASAQDMFGTVAWEEQF